MIGAVDELEAAIVARAREHRDTRWPAAPTASTPSRSRSGQAGALGAAGAPRPRAARAGARGHRGRQALGRGRHVLQRRPRGRGVRVRARSGSARCRPRRCSPATGTPSCSTRARRSAPSIEAFALEVRHLQRTEVGEVEEPFRDRRAEGLERDAAQAQPVASEQLCGLARVLRGNLQAGLENVALWHERDMSHSSVERIVLPDSLHARLLHAGAVPRDRRGHASCTPTACSRTSTRRTGSCSASRCCSRWSSRADARRRVPDRAAQRDDARGRSAGRSATCSREDPEVTGALGDERLDACFDLDRRGRRTSTASSPLDARRARSTARREPQSRCPTTTRGKVRELYEVGHDRMLVVASDRISVFDVVLADLIPDKGRVLTALSTFWFEQTARPGPEPPRVVGPHRLPRDRGPRRRRPGDARAGGPPVRLECVARGYLFGAGVVRLRGDRHGAGPRRSRPGCARPSGSRSRSSRPPPRPRAATTSRSPTPRPPSSSATTSSSSSATSRSRVYGFGAAHAAERGLVLADTKLEFGTVDDELVVIDEMLTPDSSRYWRPRTTRRDVAAVVRQAVRARPLPVDRLEPGAAGAAPAGVGDRGHAGALRRGLRAGHRRQLRHWYGRRRANDAGSRRGSTSPTCPACSTRRARRSSGRSRRSATPT